MSIVSETPKTAHERALYWKALTRALVTLLIILFIEGNLRYLFDPHAKGHRYLELSLLYPLYGEIGCGIELLVVLFPCYLVTKSPNRASKYIYLAVGLIVSALICLISGCIYILNAHGWAEFSSLVISISAKILIPTYVFWLTVRPARGL